MLNNLGILNKYLSGNLAGLQIGLLQVAEETISNCSPNLNTYFKMNKGN